MQGGRKFAKESYLNGTSTETNAVTNAADVPLSATDDFLVVIPVRIHPIPFRTRKLSSPGPMILQVFICGKVGRRQFYLKPPTLLKSVGGFLLNWGE